jgi:hypothetical protein
MPAYFWNKEKRRYETASGIIVSDSLLRSYVDEAASRFGDQFRGIALQYQQEAVRPGDVTAWRAWRDTMRAKLPPVHRAFGAIALGGVAQVSDPEWDGIDELVDEQRAYLDQFADKVFAGEKDASGDAFLNQSSYYGLAGYSTFANTDRRYYVTSGAVEEERRIATMDDRICPTCEAEYQKDWQPIGTLRRIGDSECLFRCRCHFIFRAAVIV